MNLPDGIKHAVHMGANEAFLEWIFDPTEEYLDTLGGSYQGIGDGAPDAQANAFIADLAAWDDGTSASPGAKLDALVYAAGIEFARGLIAVAAGIGATPPRVQPYMAELAPLVIELKRALSEGSFDEEEVDLAAIIWGSGDGDAESDDSDS